LRKLRTGTDLVQVSRIAESLKTSVRFRRQGSDHQGAHLSEVGLDWRQIEVLRDESGQCRLAITPRRWWSRWQLNRI
jgi:phosphopantetheinyl transferase (holo-ACP synthase)